MHGNEVWGGPPGRNPPTAMSAEKHGPPSFASILKQSSSVLVPQSVAVNAESISTNVKFT